MEKYSFDEIETILDSKLVVEDNIIDTQHFTKDMINSMNFVEEANLASILKRFFTGFYLRRHNGLKTRDELSKKIKDLRSKFKHLDGVNNKFSLTTNHKLKIATRLSGASVSFGITKLDASSVVELTKTMAKYDTKQIGISLSNYLKSKTDSNTMVEDMNGVTTIFDSPEKYFGKFDKLRRLVDKSNRGFFKTSVLGWDKPGIIFKQTIGFDDNKINTLIGQQHSNGTIAGELITSKVTSNVIELLAKSITNPNAKQLMEMMDNAVKLLDGNILLVEDTDKVIQLLDKFENVFDGSEHYDERYSYAKNIIPKLLSASLKDLHGRIRFAETIYFISASYLAGMKRSKNNVAESEVPELTIKNDVDNVDMSDILNATDKDRKIFQTFEKCSMIDGTITETDKMFEDVDRLLYDMTSVNNIISEAKDHTFTVDYLDNVKKDLFLICENNNIDITLSDVRNNENLITASESIIKDIKNFILRIFRFLFGMDDKGGGGGSLQSQYVSKQADALSDIREKIRKHKNNIEYVHKKHGDRDFNNIYKPYYLNTIETLENIIFNLHFPLYMNLVGDKNFDELLRKIDEVDVAINTPLNFETIDKLVKPNKKFWDAKKFWNDNNSQLYEPLTAFDFQNVMLKMIMSKTFNSADNPIITFVGSDTYAVANLVEMAGGAGFTSKAIKVFGKMSYNPNFKYNSDKFIDFVNAAIKLNRVPAPIFDDSQDRVIEVIESYETWDKAPQDTQEFISSFRKLLNKTSVYRLKIIKQIKYKAMNYVNAINSIHKVMKPNLDNIAEFSDTDLVKISKFMSDIIINAHSTWDTDEIVEKIKELLIDFNNNINT